MSFLKVHLLLTFLKVIYILQTDKWINKTVFAKPNSTVVMLECCSECELPFVQNKWDRKGEMLLFQGRSRDQLHRQDMTE